MNQTKWYNTLAQTMPSSGLKILDIGARGGIGERFLSIASLVDVVGFEPDITECDTLNAAITAHGCAPWRSLCYLPVAVGRDEDNRHFYITRSPDLSSLLRPNMALHRTLPNSERMEIVREVRVQTRALDSLAVEDASSIAGAAFIKVDTQGSELEILQSGENLLKESVVGVEVEAEFQELYESQPLFSDVDNYLRSLGFDLYWFDRYYMPTTNTGSMRQVGHINALYLLSPFRTKRLDPDAWRAWLAIAACYGLGEACWQTLAILEERGIEFDGQVESLRAACKRLSQPLPWSLRQRAWLLRRALVAFVRPTLKHRRRLAYSALKQVNADGISWRIPTPGL